MKIHAWFSRGLVPLDMLEEDGLFSLFFQDEEGETSDRVLLTGISGAGKSTLMQAMGSVWAGLSSLLAGERPEMPMGNAALWLDDLLDAPVMLCYARDASFWDALAARYPKVALAGIRGDALACPPSLHQALSMRMAQPDTRPNMLLMTEDAPPVASGDLSGYAVTLQEVRAALRAAGGFPEALQQLAQKSPDCLAGFRTQINELLYGKQLADASAHYQVLTRSGALHDLEALSSGEKRILLLLFSVWGVLHPGGVVLIDEPESHIHPSQVLGLLSTLEERIAQLEGQLLISSHMPQVWRRYENLGLVVSLEEQA